MGTERKGKKAFWVYMLECAGGYIYTGIAIDPEARFLQHLAGKGSRFTRVRKPIRIIGKRRYPDRGTALRIESALKKLKREEKRKWAACPERPAASSKRSARKKVGVGRPARS